MVQCKYGNRKSVQCFLFAVISRFKVMHEQEWDDLKQGSAKEEERLDWIMCSCCIDDILSEACTSAMRFSNCTKAALIALHCAHRSSIIHLTNYDDLACSIGIYFVKF